MAGCDGFVYFIEVVEGIWCLWSIGNKYFIYLFIFNGYWQAVFVRGGMLDSFIFV